jgi:hypothetical protein
MEFNEKIMKKVVQRERKSGYFDRCLKARVCPVCGGHLDHGLTDGYIYPDELFECQSCKFTHRKG